MKNTKHEALPYPLDKLSLSRADNATPQQLAECKKFPYRRIVGQLMHGMVHTLYDNNVRNDNNVRIKCTIPIRKQSWT